MIFGATRGSKWPNLRFLTVAAQSDGRPPEATRWLRIAESYIAEKRVLPRAQGKGHPSPLLPITSARLRRRLPWRRREVVPELVDWVDEQLRKENHLGAVHGACRGGPEGTGG